MPYDRKAFVVSIIPFALFISFIGGYLLLAVLTGYRPASQIDDKEFMARQLWAAAVLILSIVLIWNVGVAVRVLLRATCIERWFVVGAVLLAGALYGLGYPILAGAGRGYLGQVGTEAIRLTERSTGIPVPIVVVTLNTITAAVVAMVIGALGVLMYRGETDLSPECERAITRESRVLLLSSAALLVAGVVEIVFLFHWTSTIHPSVLGVKTAVAANTFAIQAGAVFSMMLLMIYAPVFVLHESRVARLVDTQKPADREKWLKKNGLHRSLSGILTNLVALASPWLSGLGTLFFK
jgi:hypothetical protein